LAVTLTDVEETTLTIDQVLAQVEPEFLTLTDDGNGRRFADLFDGIIRYVIDLDQWLVWNGKCWEPDIGGLKVLALVAGLTRWYRAEAEDASNEEPENGGDSPRERLRKHATATESLDSRQRTVKIARTLKELQVTEDELDSNAHHLVAQDCTINLQTGERIKTSAEQMNTRVLNVAYDPEATSPFLTQYLETFIPEPEDQDVIFAILGNALRGGNIGRLFPIIVGNTTSGKSQLVEALEALLGRYTTSIGSSIFRGNLDDKPRPDLVKAMYTRLAIAVEASKQWELHADQMKRLTGGERVPYRGLYQGSIEAKPRFTPLIVTNEMPRIKGADTALKRRVIVMRFDHTLPKEKEDTRIKERFIHDTRCQQALVARLVRGARSPMVVNGLRWDLVPQRFALETMESFGQMNHVDEWLMWMRTEGRLHDAVDGPLTSMAKASVLHRWYTLWVNEHGDKNDKQEALSLKDLGVALRERGWESKPSAGMRWIGRRLTRGDEIPIMGWL
jgi:P4 family phage/plasmid primase-like protien